MDSIEAAATAVAKAEGGGVESGKVLAEAQQRLLSVLNRVKEGGVVGPQEAAELRAVAGLLTGAAGAQGGYPKPEGKAKMQKDMSAVELLTYVQEQVEKACAEGATPGEDDEEKKKPWEKRLKALAEQVGTAKVAFGDTEKPKVPIVQYEEPNLTARKDETTTTVAKPPEQPAASSFTAKREDEPVVAWPADLNAKTFMEKRDPKEPAWGFDPKRQG